MTSTRTGPLTGTKIIELAGVGPGSLCLHAPGRRRGRRHTVGTNPAGRGRAQRRRPLLGPAQSQSPSVGLDLKNPEAVGLVLDLVAQADALIEGFRPGVAERLGVGPADCHARNAKLVYGRMTGWGQVGPMADTAGHDIDYIAISGALWPIGRAGSPPVPPLNLVGDFGGGGMMLAFGVVSALLEASRSGQGQVVDAAMIDGSSSLMTMIYAFRQFGWWEEKRGSNILDTGAHFYEVYETKRRKVLRRRCH